MQRQKFQVQKHVRDFTSKIEYVINSTPCVKHEKRLGQPCWQMPNMHKAICNVRAAKIFTGTPSFRASTGIREYKRSQKESAA